MNSVFLDYFRCPDDLVAMRQDGQLSNRADFFHLNGITCYGHYVPDRSNGASPPDLRIQVDRDACHIPFDLGEIVSNLRLELYPGSAHFTPGAMNATAGRWMRSDNPLRARMPAIAQRLFFHLFRKRIVAAAFPRWPLDLSVERIMREVMKSVLAANDGQPVPFIWFWPDGANACAIMTHDLLAPTDADLCEDMARLDEEYGIRASYQVVPETARPVDDATLNALAQRGHEINIHGLNLDERLFEDRGFFIRQAERINHYAREFGAWGFRAPMLQRNPFWFDALDFDYDMSYPNVAHLDFQSGGCATVLPYMIGEMVELPLTTTQDLTLLHTLGQRSISLWKQQVQIIMRSHGLLSFLFHPRCVANRKHLSLYLALLEHISALVERENVIHMLPREASRWWRQRREMGLVRQENGWKITGEGAERARVAFARIIDGRLAFEVHRETAPKNGRNPSS